MSDHDFLYYQPKWGARNIVRHFVAALTIGASTLSLSYVYQKTEQGWTRDSVISRDYRHGRHEQFIAATTVFLTVASGSSWVVPANVALVTQVDCIAAGGAGGSGAAGVASGSGGSGGAWSRSVNIPVVAGSSVGIGVGAGGAFGPPPNNGTDTWFNATSLANAIANGSAVSCGAEHGFAGNNTGAAGPAGGAATNGVGTSKFSGGAGQGTNSGAGGGGGGAAGPNGNGLQGASPPSAAGGAGGAGDNGSGGVGGAIPAGVGGNGTEYDATHGSGGGGGGAQFSPTQQGGAGGNYGAAGGGGSATLSNSGGSGANGLIVLIYTAVAILRVRPRTYLRR